ncbi:GPCR, PTH-type [Sclerotinia borealis F-4128]|uniref:GPCR, PTH-type n=1 Tax=Sclerotinia borealis (strain F-4128) TaxID=1432307 RepID=W9CUK6_SCLBF|nr:GPCR, PTH-type [Sclerotinia borealis F-4128]
MSLYPNATIAVIICTVFPIMSGLAVGLRSYAHRRLLGSPFRTDDYLIIFGQIIALSTCIMGVYGACEAGFGWPLREIARFGVQESFGKMVLVSHVLWASSISVIRIALLFYYRRLFSTRTFMIADTTVIFLSVLWWLTAILTTTISFTWNPQFQQTQFSINFFAWMIAATVMNISLDIATLTLPVFVIGSLKLSGNKKIMVSGIFTLGIFCIIASVVRLYYIVTFYIIKHPTPEESASAIFHAFIWAIIEPCTSIIAASLPTYAPIIKKLYSKGYLNALGPFSSRKDTIDSVKKSTTRVGTNGVGARNDTQVSGRPERSGGKGWTELRSPRGVDVFGGNEIGIGNDDDNKIGMGRKEGLEMHVLNKPGDVHMG